MSVSAHERAADVTIILSWRNPLSKITPGASRKVILFIIKSNQVNQKTAGRGRTIQEVERTEAFCEAAGWCFLHCN